MLALISGQGGLPARIARAQQTRPLICVLNGFDPDGIKADITFRLEHIGTLLAQIKARGVSDVCLCGAIERPAFDPAALDSATLPLVPILQQALGAGDDGALRAIMALLEDQGFTVRAAHELVPDILAPAGVLSQKLPDDRMRHDIARADAVLAALAPLDVGQGCVVGAGHVFGIETISGTDHMLASLHQKVRAAQAVMVKSPKSGQDLRADMPTIGPATIDAIVAAGLAGLVVDAGRVILLEPMETVQRADKAGLVLWSRERV